MAALAEHRTIAVATSIPPALARRDAGRPIGEAYQRLCIRSWIDCGFHVLSVNDPAEIPVLAALHPQVAFVPANRNASAWSGRKTPFIADLLLALHSVPESVLGIINSDLVFEPSLAWQERLPSLVKTTLVTAHRYNTTSLRDGALLQHRTGLDAFFFDRSLLPDALKSAMPFAMGLPWWDYWLPCLAAFANRRILVVDRPAVIHLSHSSAYAKPMLQEFARVFAGFVVSRLESARDVRGFGDIVAACRELVALPLETAGNSGASDPKISALMSSFCLAMRQNAGALESAATADGDSHAGAAAAVDAAAAPPAGRSLDPAAIFRRFDRRRDAGEALVRARIRLHEPEWRAAGPELAAALNETPADSNVLTTFGEFCFRCGELEKARAAWSTAEQRDPDAIRPLYNLGIVLRAMNRREEAIACFERLVHRKPEFRNGYIELAMLLKEARRYREALSCLDSALDRWPDFPKAAELRNLIRQEWVPPPERLSWLRGANARHPVLTAKRLLARASRFGGHLLRRMFLIG